MLFHPLGNGGRCSGRDEEGCMRELIKRRRGQTARRIGWLLGMVSVMFIDSMATTVIKVYDHFKQQTRHLDLAGRRKQRMQNPSAVQ